jgi:hypothetical protein
MKAQRKTPTKRHKIDQYFSTIYCLSFKKWNFQPEKQIKRRSAQKAFQWIHLHLISRQRRGLTLYILTSILIKSKCPKSKRIKDIWMF